MFYTYSQNNSGGYYRYDTFDGVAEYIVVEAPNVKRANLIFWDIVKNHKEYCECCGTRWSDYSPDEGEVPMYYNKPLSEAYNDIVKYKFGKQLEDTKMKPYAAIHYADGTIELLNL